MEPLRAMRHETLSCSSRACASCSSAVLRPPLPTSEVLGRSARSLSTPFRLTRSSDTSFPHFVLPTAAAAFSSSSSGASSSSSSWRSWHSTSRSASKTSTGGSSAPAPPASSSGASNASLGPDLVLERSSSRALAIAICLVTAFALSPVQLRPCSASLASSAARKGSKAPAATPSSRSSRRCFCSCCCSTCAAMISATSRMVQASDASRLMRQRALKAPAAEAQPQQGEGWGTQLSRRLRLKPPAQALRADRSTWGPLPGK
mmetsp:Transcript_110878/g.264482  ORF Transcript_110878/g.264482 Transcript_110878/m.264482 type:complete len:261 (-) Transcript_110878:29-811(-)